MNGSTPMNRVTLAICVAAATASLLSACAPPRGDPLTPQQAAVVNKNVALMNVKVAESLEESLKERGLRLASIDEIVAKRAGNTNHSVGSGFTMSSFNRTDGSLNARIVTADGLFVFAGSWSAEDDGIRCTTLEQLKSIREKIPTYGGRWVRGLEEQNCYRTYYEADKEYWLHVSGPHHVKSGHDKILPGNPFGL